MGLPAPSPTQIQALTDLKAVADAGVTAGPIKEAAIQGALDKQQEVEDFQKSTFDSLNDEIIRRYEVERRWLDGQDIASPILESDISDFAAGDEAGRLWNGGDFAPLRITEFDGGPLVVLEAEPEQDQFAPQDVILDYLQNGIAGQITIEVGATIQGPFTSASTQIIIENNTNPININDVLVLYGGGFAAVVKVTNVSSGGFCTGEATPPQITEGACTGDGGTWTAADTIDIQILVGPGGTIPAGSDIGQKTWAGFDNTERTNHVATDTDFQDLMDVLLVDLETVFNLRKTALQNQINALQNNENDNLPASAETNAQTSVTAIDGFLGVTPPTTTNISDTGITAINNEKATRTAQITARITAIAAEITFGVDNSNSYYNLRFQTAEGRCRLNNGSIVLLNDLSKALSDIQNGTTEAQGLSDRYDALIP